jgi:hypothetical protein
MCEIMKVRMTLKGAVVVIVRSTTDSMLGEIRCKSSSMHCFNSAAAGGCFKAL